jgi:hypothetical protein
MNRELFIEKWAEFDWSSLYWDDVTIKRAEFIDDLDELLKKEHKIGWTDRDNDWKRMEDL